MKMISSKPFDKNSVHYPFDQNSTGCLVLLQKPTEPLHQDVIFERSEKSEPINLCWAIDWKSIWRIAKKAPDQLLIQNLRKAYQAHRAANDSKRFDGIIISFRLIARRSECLCCIQLTLSAVQPNLPRLSGNCEDRLLFVEPNGWTDKPNSMTKQYDWTV